MIPKEIAAILNKYDKSISELAYKLRECLLIELPDIIEQPDKTAQIIGYSYGKGIGYKDMVCTIIPSKTGIKLGFYKGSELPDPGKLLTGSGKVHKYVAIKSEKDIYNKALKSLLRQAVKKHFPKTVVD